MNEELSPRERRHQRTQQAILDAARELLHESGVDGISIRSIADKIDYSPAGLYEYYGSKEEIISALCLQGFERFGRHLASIDRSLPCEEYLIRLGLAYVDFALKNADFFLLMFTTAPMLVPQDNEGMRENPFEHLGRDDAFSILLRGVERCIAEGIYQARTDFDSLSIARAAWSLTHGMAMLQLTVLKQLPIDEQAMRYTLRAFFQGVRLV